MHSRSAKNADTSNNDNMDYNERILAAIADFWISRRLIIMEPLQKSMIWSAQPCDGGIPPKPCLEVKRQPNFDKHSIRLKKKFCSAILGG